MSNTGHNLNYVTHSINKVTPMTPDNKLCPVLNQNN